MTVTEPLALEQQIRPVLAALELISHGSTYSWNRSGGPGESDATRPPGELYPPHIEYRMRFENAQSEHARQMVIEAACDELVSWKKRADTAAKSRPEKEILHERILIEGNGWDETELSRHLRCTVNYVRKVRVDARIGPDGKTVALADKSRDARKVHARRLRDQGLTLRQIAIYLDCDAMTVKRDLGNAA